VKAKNIEKNDKVEVPGLEDHDHSKSELEEEENLSS